MRSPPNRGRDVEGPAEHDPSGICRPEKELARHEPSTYRWVMFCVLGVIYFLACLHRISPTVIARDLVREFGADATALGIISSAYFYLYAAVQPPVGILSDTLGPRRVITGCTMISCVGVVLFGLAPNMVVATAARALIGIGVGGVFVPSLKLFSRWYHENEFAGVTGVFLAAGNAGNLAASLPLTFLVILLGWRMSFLAIGAVTLLLALLAWAILRDRPEDRGPQPLEETPNPPSTEEAPAPDGLTTLGRLRTVFRKPNFWLVTASTFFFGGPALTLQGLWAVPYLMDVHGYTRLQAGGVLMLLPLGFIIGAPTFGFLADRLPVGRKKVLQGSLGLGLSCWAVFLISGGSPPKILLPILFLLMGSCGGGSLSLYMTVTKELFPPHLTGTAVGLMNPAAFFSTALFQPLSGLIMDAVGRKGSAYPLEAYEHVFVAIFISAVLALLAISPLRIPRKSG